MSVRPCLVALGLALLVSALCAAAPNLFPDPSFEATGQAGAARTGAKAGHLTVVAQNHWNAIAGPLAIEPFARYRVTEWYKGSVGQGTFFAPYCYSWDSYEWAFVSAKAVQAAGDWTQTEVTFVAPTTTMYVHPLAYIEAANCDVWADDVVVEKIAEPETVMAEIAAKPDPDDTDKRLLGRWWVKRGDLARAGRLMDSSDGLTRADLATVIAKALPDPARRRPYVLQVVAYGGPTYYEGMARFQEMSEGMSDADKVAICAEALRLNPGLDRCGRAVGMIVASVLSGGAGPHTVAEDRARLGTLGQALRDALKAAPAGSPAAAEAQAAAKALDDAAAKVADRASALGHCEVRLGGKTLSAATHAILIPDKPTPQEKYAARDLNYQLELITGHALPTRAESQAGQALGLYVGRCRALAKLVPGVRPDALGIEGLHIETVGPRLFLVGNKRGVLYAVSTFLEDYLGCRWFTPDCATWPTSGVVKVPDIKRSYAPALEYRAGDYPVSRQSEFALHSRFNGAGYPLGEEQGSHIEYRGFVHTFSSLVPPEKYFATHPEYFSQVNGQRQSGYAQLCLTNPDVLRIATETVRQWIKESPGASIISVSQNDAGLYCTCDNCRAVAQEEGSESGPLLRFVNAIADNIAKDYPNVALDTLAYQWSRKPPKITRPRPNVIVRLCSIECCFSHPLGTDPANASFADDIRGWNRMCNRLYIWDYVINYAHSICPFPNLYSLKPNIDFFIRNGVKGIYEESCYFTKGSELQELRNYIMAKTLWDPEYDTDKAIREFCDAYYGAAAPLVQEYIQLIHAPFRDGKGPHMPIYAAPNSYLTATEMTQAEEVFDRADEAVGSNPTLLHRVQVARLPVIYAQIALGGGQAFTEQGNELVQAAGADVSALAKRFETIARAEGVTMINEGGGLDGWLAALPRQPKRLGVVRLANPALSVAILPDLGGRIWRMQLAKGRDLLMVHRADGGLLPSDGGYEEYSTGDYRSPGWNEPYTVKEHGDRFVVLEGRLANGLVLTRRIELDAEKPLVTITSTLTNPTGEARAVCLRAHPEFSVSSLAQCSVKVLRPDGAWRTLSPTDLLGGQGEKDVWLRGDDAPASAWAISDPGAGYVLEDRITEGKLGQALLNVSGKLNRINLELYSPQVQLAPGQSLRFGHAYEVLNPGAR
jgi:hypothetical protein